MPRMTREEALAAGEHLTEADFVMISDEESGIDQAMVDRMVDTVHRLGGRPSLTGPGKQSPQIRVRVSESVHQRVTDLARRTGRRRSQVVRDALDAYLAMASILIAPPPAPIVEEDGRLVAVGGAPVTDQTVRAIQEESRR